MNNKKLYTIGFILMFLICNISCSGDDDGGSTNLPPESFSLIGVTNGAVSVDVLPTFRWGNAVDPEGSNISYRLLLDTSTNPETVIEENITNTTYSITDKLQILTQYYWRVEALDNAGNITTSETYSFTTRNLSFTNNLVTDNAAFAARRNHSSVVFDGKMWVIGGQTGLATDSAQNDVWYSTDGLNWQIANVNAPFDARYNHTSVVYDNKIWVIGGYDATANFRNDVWFSSDGVNWSLATDTAQFSPRWKHTSVVFDGKIWVIGGRSADGFQNDVWYTTDGINWVSAVENANFSERTGHTTVVFDNKMYLIGGRNITDIFSDIWYSSDGITWNEVSGDLSFVLRSAHTSVVYDSKLWIISGVDNSQPLSDIWYSDDGNNWNLATDNISSSARLDHTSLIFNQKIWVIAGYVDADEANDIWSFD